MIRTDHLCKVFRGSRGEETRAVDDVSLTIETGQFAVLTGASGSGKSTLLSLLGALARPSSGSIVLNDRELNDCSDVELARVRGKIGFVFQNFSLLPRLPVWENVTYPLVPRGIPAATRFDIARELLKRLGLASKMENCPEQLSGGEQQRVAVARALAAEPQMILADEPTSNLDETAASDLADIFREIHAKGVTLILSTHSSQFLNLATTVFEMHEGKLKCS